MSNFIFNTLLWTLALYGLFDIAKLLLHTYCKPKISSDGIYLFIAVKNQENKIEGFLRSFLFKFIYGKEENINNIFVVDLNSTDETSEILDILANDYDCVKFTNLKNCKEMLDSISSKSSI